ncbi:MAG: hypothetical protein K2I25_09480 [Muribaculaceae bacterium]|nr:hypothetical protein [Muribaculaceae bacterium]
MFPPTPTTNTHNPPQPQPATRKASAANPPTNTNGFRRTPIYTTHTHP